MKSTYHVLRITYRGCALAQSGRSMIEMLGILALAGVMAFGAFKLYQTLRARQTRITAEMELSDIASNAKLLFRGRGDYSNISLDYLVKAGAVPTNKSPIPNAELSVMSEELGKKFAIRLDGLSYGDCAYFATAKLDWAEFVRINGFTDNAKSFCYEIEKNRVEFIVE